MNGGQTDDALKGEEVAIVEALDEGVVATEEEGVAVLVVVEVATVGTETNEWVVGAEEEGEEGVEEVNNNNSNKVKVHHQRPAEEEEAGQKGVEPTPPVEEAVMAN